MQATEKQGNKQRKQTRKKKDTKTGQKKEDVHFDFYSKLKNPIAKVQISVNLF